MIRSKDTFLSRDPLKKRKGAAAASAATTVTIASAAAIRMRTHFCISLSDSVLSVYPSNLLTFEIDAICIVFIWHRPTLFEQKEHIT